MINSSKLLLDYFKHRCFTEFGNNNLKNRIKQKLTGFTDEFYLRINALLKLPEVIQSIII